MGVPLRMLRSQTRKAVGHGPNSQSSRQGRLRLGQDPTGDRCRRPPASGPQPTDASHSRQKETQASQGLDAVGRLNMLRKAFEAQPEQGPDAKPNPWAEQWANQITRLEQLACRAPQPAAQGARRRTGGDSRRLAAGTHAAANDQHRGRRQCAARSRCARPSRARSARASGTLAVGTQLEPGAALVRIVNKRADRGRLDDLRRLVNRLEGERAALIARRDDLESAARGPRRADAGVHGGAPAASWRRAIAELDERDRRGDRQPRGSRARAGTRHAAGRRPRP